MSADVAYDRRGRAWGGSASAAPPTRCLGHERAVAPGVCVDRASPLAPRVVTAVRELIDQYSLRSVVFGVWAGQRELVSGALGNAYPGVRANRRMHFRIGNTTEAMTTALLLRLVDEGKIRLDDRLSKWYPSLPRADEITVEMLAGESAS